MKEGIEFIGGVQVSVDLKVSHDEIAKWRPETIRAFFAGLSLVLSAREAGSQQGRIDVGLDADRMCCRVLPRDADAPERMQPGAPGLKAPA